MSESITLITKETEKVKVNSGISRMSELIKGIIEDSSNEEIPIEQIMKETLDIIIVYAEHHNYRNPIFLPCPLPSSDLSDYMDEWHIKFLKNLSPTTFSELLQAANYLQMKSLLNILLGFLASQVREKSVDALRTEYDIQEPMTEETEEELMKEFSWVYNISINKH